MTMSLVLTLIGDDRPGIIEALARVLVDHRASWLESHTERLAGKVAGIVHVRVPSEQADALARAVEALGTSGLRVSCEREAEERREDPARRFLIEISGPDRPGLILDFARVLARHDINVDELHTESQALREGGARMFVASARLAFPREADGDDVRRTLDLVADMLGLDVSLRDVTAQPRG